MRLTKRQENILLIIILLVMMTGGWGIYSAIRSAGKQQLTIHAAPKTATIFINGVATNDTSINLSRGTYTIRLQQEGFKTIEQTISIDDQPIVLGASLPPITEAAKKIADELKGQYSEEFDDRTAIDPMIKYAPYKNLLFSIGKSSPGESLPVQLKISSVKGYRNAPIEYMQRLNVDPSNYIYEFSYNNPFN